jgi:hypothetical protein
MDATALLLSRLQLASISQDRPYPSILRSFDVQTGDDHNEYT